MTDKLSALKKSAVESAHSLWKGMDEALGTLCKLSFNFELTIFSEKYESQKTISGNA